LALAIFEDLDLGEFGGRIPMLTFEVVADEAVGMGEMLRDASGGLIEAGDDRPLPGYAAHGSSIEDSIAALVELCGVQLVERDGRLRSPVEAPPILIGKDELGCNADGRAEASLNRNRPAESDMPAVLAMTYYDPERDYQTGQMQASGGRQGARRERIELPAVLTGGQARVLVENALARKYRIGNRIRLSLPPARMSLRPGDTIQLGDDPHPWLIRSVTIDGLAIEIEAEAAPVGVPLLPADSGRSVAQPDEPIGRTELVLFETPPGGAMLSDGLVAFVAAASDGAWKAVPVELRLGTETLPALAVRRPAVIGRALSILESGAPMIIDELSSVVVKLVQASAPLLNAEDEALMAGANLALLGQELIQFGQAEEIAPRTFRLTRLLRGRRGTEWAAEVHQAGEPFCLIGRQIQPVEAPPGAVGANLAAVAHGIGDTAPLPEAQRLLTGEAMRPPSPCHLTIWRESGGIGARWVRRSHRGWDWLDGVGVPSDPFPELYRVTIEGLQGALVLETGAPSLACDLADLPGIAGEAIRLTVATVGPRAVSHGICATLNL
jgi:hypothetical protein